MPTGGGKSLCYQLPAVLQEGRTAVVISPLIALMQDQVAQLRQMGIPAVFLNSAVLESDRRELKQKAIASEYRLMYVSPERALMDGTADWLRQVPLSFFAIDEPNSTPQGGHRLPPEFPQAGKTPPSFPGPPHPRFYRQRHPPGPPRHRRPAPPPRLPQIRLQLPPRKSPLLRPPVHGKHAR